MGCTVIEMRTRPAFRWETSLQTGLNEMLLMPAKCQANARQNVVIRAQKCTSTAYTRGGEGCGGGCPILAMPTFGLMLISYVNTFLVNKRKKIQVNVKLYLCIEDISVHS